MSSITSHPVVTDWSDQVTDRGVAPRIAMLDAAKGIAACVIVAHHLTYYGRASDVAMELAPKTISFLYEHARMVVQLFMVLGGFGIAWSTVGKPRNWKWPVSALVNRYLRLIFPYLVALGLLITAARFFGSLGDGNPLVDSISLLQVVTHVFFIHELFGFDGLSAGTWYLCIDLQFAALFFVLYTLAWFTREHFHWKIEATQLMSWVIIPMGILSAFIWNRNSAFDWSILYFFSSFVLGVMVAWERRQTIPSWVVLAFCTMLCIAAYLDFRPRLLVAMVSAAFVWNCVRLGDKCRLSPFFDWLGQISYSLFLVHYVVCGFILEFADEWIGGNPWRALLILGFAFFASIAAGAILNFSVERPAIKWLKQRKRPILAGEIRIREKAAYCRGENTQVAG